MSAEFLVYVTFRGRYRIPAISKTKILVTIVNGFHLLIITGRRKRYILDVEWILDPPSEFSEICNGNVLSVTNYKVAIRVLTVISYDSVVLGLIAETRRKRIFKRFLQAPP